MHPAIRSQANSRGDDYSAKTMLDFHDDDPENIDRTRQEFKAEADVNTILKKFGWQQFGRQPLYGDIDFDRGLHEAMEIVQSARDLYRRMPADLKAKYPTEQDLILGLADGSLVKDLEAVNNPKPAPVTEGSDNGAGTGASS